MNTYGTVTLSLICLDSNSLFHVEWMKVFTHSPALPSIATHTDMNLTHSSSKIAKLFILTAIVKYFNFLVLYSASPQHPSMSVTRERTPLSQLLHYREINTRPPFICISCNPAFRQV